MIKYTDLRNLIIKSIGNDTDKLAYITHYLQNPDSEYYKTGEELLRECGIIVDTKKIDWNIPFFVDKKPKFKFIDLFAGIGGVRLAFQKLGGKSVFSSEWDMNAQITYETNYGEVPFGDITKIDEKNVPDHDVLLAGFPCQAFSIAGRRKGFEDTRGTLFFEVARIIKEKKPKAFFLENVKGLINHDKGRTLKTILEVLRNDLGYYVPDPETLNAKNFGVPQKRERIYIVGFSKESKIKEFIYPKGEETKKRFIDIREKSEVSPRYYLSNVYLETLRRHRQRHEDKGNGFGFEIIKDDEIANTIVVGGMGRERNLVIDKRLTNFKPETNIKGEINKEGIRKMTPREWARLQGLPDEFIVENKENGRKISATQAYKQLGNSVAVPAVEAMGREIIKKLVEAGIINE
jgi:DNA (cytosine-5)-methyltransferase 1